MKNEITAKISEIKKDLKKIGWKIHAERSTFERSAYYITISKNLDNGEEFNNEIRFSDHEQPHYYPHDADYECRFDLDGEAWSKLKPVLEKLYNEV